VNSEDPSAAGSDRGNLPPSPYANPVGASAFWQVHFGLSSCLFCGRTICGARSAIYIGGWSVNVRIRLLRGKDEDIAPYGNPTLGELLLQKAKEGVTVLLLVWDDQTSLHGAAGHTVRP